ncbi:MAG: DUF6177 family protein [Naasia sp.]
MARSVVSLPHPLVDSSGPGWAVHSTTAPIVSLSAGRSALLVDATRAGTRVVMVTPPASRMTFPLFHLLHRLGGAWLTRDADGVLRHAVGGGEVPDEAWAIDPRRRDEADPVAEDLSALPGRLPADALRPWLQLSVVVGHRARLETRLGGTLSAITEELLGRFPTSWGGTEPATSRWDRDAITGLARSRMPEDFRVNVAGSADAPFSAIVRAARADTGVTEETRLVVPRPPGTDSEHELVVDLFAKLADRSDVLMATAWTMRGPADATIAPYWPSTPQPLAAVIGARAVRAMGVTPETFSDELDALRVGNRRAPALVVGFGGDEVRWSRFRSAVRGIGPDALNEVLLPAGLARKVADDAS